MSWARFPAVNLIAVLYNLHLLFTLCPYASGNVKFCFIRDWKALPVHVWEIETLAQFHRVLHAELLGF